MSVLNILFIIGVINSLRCQSIEPKMGDVLDVSRTADGGAENPLEVAGQRSTAGNTGTKATSHPRLPSRYFEFHVREEPPPPGTVGLFEQWFAPSLDEESSA